jgi:hypothetical protein
LVESNIVMTQITAAGIVIGVINWFKNSPYFPWFTAEKKNLLRTAAVVGSFLATAGIHYTWNAGTRTVGVSIPTLAGLWAFGVGWVKSFITQEITYQATSNNSALLKSILAAVKPAKPSA